MSFARHAAPPPGEWINDPNGLIFAGGQWRLFVQHSDAAPDYKAIGWARFSSADLLHWAWDGPVIPPNDLGQAYSGSIVKEEGGLAAYLTRHDGSVQRQSRLTSCDDGLTWREGPPLGPEGRNVRDPFVFFCQATGEWRMLVAEPCDWTDWGSDPPSRLAVWRNDGRSWMFVAHIGPWMPPGVMWEVPLLIDFGEMQALVLSIVDRRSGTADCAVRYWLGQFDGQSFVPDSPPGGLLLDQGPDFYAAMVGTGDAFGPILIAWASAWGTARAMPWSGGVRGGPITFPRRLRLNSQSKRLTQEPAVEIAPSFKKAWDGREGLRIELRGDRDCTLTVKVDTTGVSVTRQGLDGLLDWNRRETLTLTGPQIIECYEDAGLIELFVRPAGFTITAFLPGAIL